MVLGGSSKSCTALPSRKNSGLKHTPKSAPAILPDESSRIGMTVSIMEPGRTVLLTTTTCQESIVFRTSPISRHTFSTNRRLRLPLEFPGVPTQTIEMSHAEIASAASVVARKVPEETVSSRSRSTSFSTIGLEPRFTKSTLSGFVSTPITECPSLARQAADTTPT